MDRLEVVEVLLHIGPDLTCDAVPVDQCDRLGECESG
jgi:hypothetical protein